MNSETTKPTPAQVNPIIVQAAAYVKRNTWKRTKNPNQLELPLTPVRRNPDGHEND